MAMNHFTENQKTAFQIMRDLANPHFSYNVGGEAVTKAQLENTLRDTINNKMLEGKSFRKVLRNPVVANQVFELIEELVDITVVEEIMACPFMEQFAEIRNLALGDKNEFYSEGGVVYAAEFSGNRWDTDRQQLDLGSKFSLKTHWIYVHVYDEFERFLLGYASMERLIDKMYKAINRYMKEHIYATFESAGTAVPAHLTASGNSQEQLITLMEQVSALSDTDTVRLAGTRLALAKLGAVLEDKYFADSQREALAATGSIANWMGAELVVIPQVLKAGSVSELALNNETIFVIAGDSKPIKVVYEGDTYTKMVTDNQVNNDMTFEAQIQTKVGFGLVLSEAFGKFTFTA